MERLFLFFILRIEYIIGIGLVGRFSDKAREMRLPWLGHVQMLGILGGGC